MHFCNFIWFGLTLSGMLDPSPLFSEIFHIPGYKYIDKNLIGSSVLFGIGWSLGGLCPGPVIAILNYNLISSILFMSVMLTGLFIGGNFK